MGIGSSCVDFYLHNQMDESSCVIFIYQFLLGLICVILFPLTNPMQKKQLTWGTCDYWLEADQFIDENILNIQ